MKKIILSLLVALMATTGAWAQETLTVFDGTATNEYIPMCGYYFDNYTKSECIIPASELTAMKGGTITAITFYAKFVDESSSTFDPANQKVFLKEVSETTLELSSDMTDATEVFNGLLSMPTTNPDGYTITFSQGYTYNGGNLLIGVYNDTKGSWNKVRWYGIGSNLSSRVSAYGYNDDNLETVSLSSAQTFLPKTTFTYTMPVPAGPTTSGITWNTGTNSGTFLMPAYDMEVSTELWYKLSETGDNTAYQTKTNVFLERTLQTGGWNTFCAPFDISAAKVTALGMTVKELADAEIDGGTLILTFSTASSIEGGKPYLVQVASALDFTEDGNEFEDITPDWEAEPVTITGIVTFQPVLVPESMTANDKTKLFVKNGNTLTFPNTTGNINAFRAYFELLGDNAMDVKSFVMDFEDDADGINSLTPNPSPGRGEEWYDLSGRKVNGQLPKGIYIHNGRKEAVK